MNLPVGIQTFEGIVTGNYVYVDKTQFLYNLIKPGSESPTAGGPKYFLSRPRRFGKSLTISTFDAIFSGQKELFEGLAISKTDYKWDVFPVLRFDMSSLDKETEEGLRKSLHIVLAQMAEQHEITLDSEAELGLIFGQLLRKLHQKYRAKVVVLIDEYDAPIIRHITDVEKASGNRDVLRDFYGTLKSRDEDLRFVFLTGVSKFSKVGVFSGLNNLNDLTMDTRYAGLCGYTQEELESNFSESISVLAQKEELSLPEVLDKIRYWYNGYRFSKVDVRVYNPFSTLLLFEQGDFKFHWFETGTPTFLVELLKNREYAIEEAANAQVSEQDFSTYDLEDLNPLALLVQTGYLTIKDYDKEWGLYRFGFPNYEVENGFLTSLLQGYAKDNTLNRGHLRQLIEAIEKDDLPTFFETLTIFFAKIPYDIQLPNEKYYQSIFYMIFALMGMRIQAEVRTNKGRIDAVIETKSTVYVFEFKLGDVSGNQKTLAKEALDQIQTTAYFQRYQGGKKPVICVGVAFDTKARNIEEWVTQ